MAKNLYQTAQGRWINVEQLRLLNEKSVAVGNMHVNARGDQVSPNGEIIKSRNEIMKERYTRNIEPVVKYNPHKKRQMQEFLEQQIQNSTAQVAPAPEPAPFNPVTAPSSTDLRESLADNVSIDLTEPTPSETRSIRRI